MVDFLALQSSIKACITYIDEVNKWFAGQVEHIRENYAGPTLQSKMREATDEKDARITAKKAECFTYLDGEEKHIREDLLDNLTQSLTSEQIAVLQALKMRKTVGKTEIDAYADKYSGQFMFLNILRDYAKERGVFLNVPMFDDATAAIDGIFKMLHDSVADFKDMPNLSLDARDILAYPEHSTRFKDFCDTLQNGLLPPKAEESPRTITESEQKMLDRIFDGVEGKDLSDAVKDAAQSPEMKELLKLSSYSHFIEEE